MAKKRPFTTYYSDGSKGRATTAQKACERATRAVLQGIRCAQVFDVLDRQLCEVVGSRRSIIITINRPRGMK
jgi:hypothetical protein